MAKGRIAAALILSLLLGIAVVRQAFVQAYAETQPARASMAYPSHPDLILKQGLIRVGEAAATGKPVDRAMIEPLIQASTKAPLAPEPFLVRGVEARLGGNEELAGRAFLEAVTRNPRSVAARYFLADHYVLTNQTREGLGEISALVRLLPQSLPKIAPYLATYATRPEAAAEVKAMIRRQPQLESVLLSELASKPANADLLLYLWSGRSGPEATGWQGRLVNALVEAGQYDQAKKAWSRFTGIATKPDQLFDPQFASRALPPFGWTLVSGASGVAEPEGNGRLHVIYYGRDDLTLASQHLILRPGRYRLSMRVDGATAEARSLEWKLACLPSAREIVAIGLDRAAKVGGIAASFEVPASGCSALRLDLTGTALEFPEQVDLTVGRIVLEPELPR